LETTQVCGIMMDVPANGSLNNLLPPDIMAVILGHGLLKPYPGAEGPRSSIAAILL